VFLQGFASDMCLIAHELAITQQDGKMANPCGLRSK